MRIGQSSRAAIGRLLLIAAACGAAGALWQQFQGASRLPRLAFEQAEVSLPGPILEHQSASARARLVNRSPFSARLLAVRSTCDCLSPRRANGQPLQPGLILPAGGEEWIDIAASTAGRAGEMRYLVVTSFSINGRVVEAPLEIGMRVRPAWRIMPRELELAAADGESADVAFCDVFDGYPDPGIELTGVDCSASDLLDVVVQPASAMAATRPVAYADLAWRYRILVRPQAKAAARRPARCFLHLRAKNPEIPSLAIPVWLADDARTIKPFPSAIVWNADRPEVDAHRILRIALAEADLSNFDLLETPDWVKARLSPAAEDRALQLRVSLTRLPPAAERSAATELVVVERGNGRVACRIPMRFIEAPPRAGDASDASQ